MPALLKPGTLVSMHVLPAVNYWQERDGFCTIGNVAMQQCEYQYGKGGKPRSFSVKCAAERAGESPGISSSAPSTAEDASKSSSTSPSASNQPARQRGFGSSAAQKPSSKAGSQKGAKGRGQDERIEQIVRQVDQEKGRQLDILPSEAAKGKVDFVRVDNWGAGTGGEEEVGNLRLKSFSPAYSTGEASGSFYESLVKRLQLLESKGELTVAQAKPLPPFERWTFEERRYLQYLTNQLAVHSALEDALSLPAVDVARPAGGDGECSGEAAAAQRSSDALALFGEPLGLHRSEALRSDIAALSAVVNKTRGSKDEQCLPQPPMGPTTQASAYAKYITQLARAAREASSPAEAQTGRHRLLAHVFAVHVAHLTSGMRVGSKAVSSLPKLRQARAVSFYRDYPQVAKDPLKVFVSAVDRAGELLQQEELREEVMGELPRAIQKTSLLLSDLAVEEKAKVSAT